LAELIHPHGSVDAERSVHRYVPAFREMTYPLRRAVT
jgi:hypothetical protein